MQKVRVGVLRGGPSNEYEISLKTGATVLKHIPEDTYDVQDIFISRDGTWHKNGLPIAPHDAVSHVDVIFNALHGQYGEDGKVQHLLEVHQIPFTGSASFASAIGMNKALSKEVFQREGIKTPYFRVLNEMPEENLSELFRTFSPPIVVKPVSGGGSLGVTLAITPVILQESIKKAFEEGDVVMIEEYIPGVEASVGVVDGYRGEDFYALPAVEIRPMGHKGHSFFDFDAKYKGMSEEVVPGHFPHGIKAKLGELARKVHRALGLRHYSRTDFIVSPNRGIFVLEVNSLPGLTDESLLPKALDAVGAPLSHFLDHVLQLALVGK